MWDNFFVLKIQIYFQYFFTHDAFFLKDHTLEDRPFLSLEEVEDYAENTASSLMYLTLEILGEYKDLS